MVTQGRSILTVGQPHPHPKGAGPQRPPHFLGSLPMPKRFDVERPNLV